MLPVLVAPRTGAWIETYDRTSRPSRKPVAPRTGAWIETRCRSSPRSHYRVAPRTGAWIETCRGPITVLGPARRSPHGSVD